VKPWPEREAISSSTFCPKRLDVLGLVMKEGVVLVTIGTAIGLGTAWAAMRMLAGLFSSVASTSASNPVLLLGTPLLLASLALVSCYVPAHKSILVELGVVLRQE
jgi:hypothetical protein